MKRLALLLSSKKRQSGQVALLGIMITAIFVGLAIGAVDVYHVLEVRNWAYQASQRAAADGVTLGAQMENGVRSAALNDPVPCVGRVTLDIPEAETQATQTMASYLADRGPEFAYASPATATALNVTGDYIVIPDNFTRGYSNNPARNRLLAAANTEWHITEPSVAVYGVISVKTFLGGLVGLDTVDITYFSATSVHQPLNVCP